MLADYCELNDVLPTGLTSEVMKRLLVRNTDKIFKKTHRLYSEGGIYEEFYEELYGEDSKRENRSVVGGPWDEIFPEPK